MKSNPFLTLCFMVFLLTGCQTVHDGLLKAEPTNNKIKKYVKNDGSHEIKKTNNGVIIYKDNTVTNTTVLPDFVNQDHSSPNFDFGSTLAEGIA